MRLPVLSWIVCVLLLLGLLAWAGSDVVPLTKDSATTEKPSEPLIENHFSLLDPSGKLLTEKDFSGKYLLVYFGFTHCPDICPTTLLLVENALNRLGDKRKKITPIFITLDPERDTPKVVGDYVSHFGSGLVGLSGSPEQVRQAADAYKVYYQKVEQPDSAMGYVIDHSSFLYLIGPDGRYLAAFPHGASEQSLTEGLRTAIK